MDEQLWIRNIELTQDQSQRGERAGTEDRNEEIGQVSFRPPETRCGNQRKGDYNRGRQLPPGRALKSVVGKNSNQKHRQLVQQVVVFKICVPWPMSGESSDHQLSGPTEDYDEADRSNAPFAEMQRGFIQQW